MEEIQEAKLVVVQFIRYIGADLSENFLEKLPDPILAYHEVQEDIWEFRTY